VGIDSDRTARIGVHGVASLIVDDFGWKFRELHESDYGIDVLVEVAIGGRPTGRLVGLQIRSGPSYFAEESRECGWVIRGPKRHLNYWLEYQLPVLIILFDTRARRAHWVHVHPEFARFTPNGYRIEVPAAQILDSSAKQQIEMVIERWAPLRGDRWSRTRNAISRCLSEGFPVLPSSSLWDLFAAKAAASQGKLMSASIKAPVSTYNIPLVGEAPAVVRSTDSKIAVPLELSDLRGTWSVPAGTTVFVCENPLVINEAVARLGAACKPLVCLNGPPNAATQYLLLGLGFCMARVKVHTDHDRGGSVITQMMFHATIDYEEWCPNTSLQKQVSTEESCLPYILAALRASLSRDWYSVVEELWMASPVTEVADRFGMADRGCTGR